MTAGGVFLVVNIATGGAAAPVTRMAIAAAGGTAAVAGTAAATGSAASATAVSLLATGPWGWIVLGVQDSSTKLTFDCWKPIVHDKSV